MDSKSNDPLNKVNKTRNRFYVTRKALTSTPTDSPWRTILESKSDPKLITATGFSYDAFSKLLSVFEPLFEDAYREFVPLKGAMPMRKRGKSLRPADALGLGLVYLSSTMKQRSLCSLFGLTEGSISRYIWSSLLTLCRCLESHPDARVEWPAIAEMEVHCAHIHTLEPRFRSHQVFGNLDSVSLAIQDIQSGAEKAFKVGEQVTVFALLTPDGCINWARYLYHSTDSLPSSGMGFLLPALQSKNWTIHPSPHLSAPFWPTAISLSTLL